jgi:hypothetical protein
LDLRKCVERFQRRARTKNGSQKYIKAVGYIWLNSALEIPNRHEVEKFKIHQIDKFMSKENIATFRTDKSSIHISIIIIEIAQELCS